MRRRPIAIAAVAVILLISAAVGWGWRYLGPPPPMPSNFQRLDPEVRAIVEETTDLVRSNRRSTDMRLQLGMVYEANHMPAIARECYEQTLSLDHDSAKAWYRLAMVQAQMGAVDDAAAAMAHAVDLEPTYAPGHWRLAMWQLERGLIDEAEKGFQRALELAPSNQAPWFGLARVHLLRGAFDEAVDLIVTHRLQHGPYAGYAHHLLSVAYRGAGQHDLAAATMRAAEPSSPQWVDPREIEAGGYARGMVADRRRAEQAMANNRFAEAVTLLEKVRMTESNNFQVSNLLGMSYIMAGRREEGLATLRHAIEQAPRSAKSHLNLAIGLFGVNNPSPADVAAASRHANEAIQLNPQAADAYVLKGRIFQARGSGDAAVRMMKKAFTVDSRTVSPLVKAGFLECDLERWGEAQQTFEQAAQWDPLSGDAHLGRAVTAGQLGDIDDALSAIEEATRLGVSHVYRNRLNTAQQQLLESAEPRNEGGSQ